MDKLAPAEPAGSTTSSFLPSPTSADRASAPASPSLSPRVGAVSPTTKTPLLLNLQGDSKARLYGTTTVAAAPGPASPTSTGAGGGGDEKPTTKAGRKDGIFRLLKLAKGEAKLLGSAVGLLFISSSVTMAVPFSMGKIIDMVTDPAFPVPFDLTLTQVFAGLGGLFVVGAAANTGRVMLIRTAGERMIAKLRTKLFRHLMRQDMVFFDKNRSGDLVSRLSVDTSIVSKSVSNNISDGLRNGISAIAGLSMMLYMSPKLTMVMMSIVPPIAIYAVIYGRYIKKLSNKTQESLGDITKVAEERLSNIRTVQAFSREDAEVERYNKSVMRVYDLAKMEAVASGFFYGGNGLLGNLAILGFLAYGGRMVLHNEITVGDLTSFMLYTAYVGSSLAGITSFYSELMKGVGASSRLFQLLDRTPAIDINATGNVVLDNQSFKGRIVFEDVSFAYPTRPDALVFQGLNLEIEPSTHIAIAGPSGKGKSTIGALLLRFYDPTAGRILVDGHDLRELSLPEWRSRIATVPQEPVLFAGTIRDNLLYSKPNATDSEIRSALKRANALGFVSRFPEGLDTFVGERGVSLSGGQKQRIAIARALLSNPSVLIMDEATSALDSQSEQSVQVAIDKLLDEGDERATGDSSTDASDDDKPSRRWRPTVITIAHRTSTLAKSDIIWVLGNDGNIVEVGHFDELLARQDGYFAQLVQNQQTLSTPGDGL